MDQENAKSHTEKWWINASCGNITISPKSYLLWLNQPDYGGLMLSSDQAIRLEYTKGEIVKTTLPIYKFASIFLAYQYMI